MRARLLHDQDGLRSFAAILENGDEVMASLQELAEAEKLTAAQITALGAFRRAELFFFDWESKEYWSIPVDEQTEVASMVGDIVLGPDEQPTLHIHAVLGKRNGGTIAGHLAHGEVRPTLEVVITETPSHLRRRKDPDSGLPLIHIGG